MSAYPVAPGLFERYIVLEAVDEHVGPDNRVLLKDIFVEGLDRAEGFVRVQTKAAGRPGYVRGDLFMLYIYGYRTVHCLFI